MISDNVYIEITNRCNLNCRDCYNSSGKNTTTLEIDPEVMMGFIKVLKKHCNLGSVTLSGGEPLLHSEFNDILESISEFSKENPDMDFNFITNGTMDNALFYDLLATRPNFHVQISLDGPNDTANASMRGAGNFQRVVSNIEGRKFANKPTFKMVINKANVMYVSEYFRFVTEVLGGNPSFAFTHYQGNAKDNWDDMILSDLEQTEVIVNLHKLYIAHGFDRNGKNLPLPAVHCDLTEPDGIRNFCVKSDGSVQPCQNFYDKLFTLANIYELDWNNLIQRLDNFSADLSKRLSIDYGCRVCPLNVKCGRGCPAMAYSLFNDFLLEDGACNLRNLSTFRIIKFIKASGN